MTHRLFGLLAPALVAALAVPAYAQQGQPGSEQSQANQPGQSSEQALGDQIRQRQQEQQAQQGQPGQQPMRQAQMSPQQQTLQIAQMIAKGGEEADRMQFQELENHLKGLDQSIRQIQQLSNQPEQNAVDIARWAGLRDEHARGIEDIVAGYFLAQRTLPPTLLQPGHERKAPQAQDQPAQQGEQQQMQQAYQDQLQTAHEILAHLHLAKVTSDPKHVQHVRQFVNDLRQGSQQYQRQVTAHLDRMESEMEQPVQQAGRPGEPGAEPGIDQPEEQRAQREGEGQGQGAQPQPGAASGGQGGANQPGG